MTKTLLSSAAAALLASSLFLSCGTPSLPRVRSEGGPPWRRIESSHLDLITDLDEGPAREAAQQLELWWGAMAKAMPLDVVIEAPERLMVLAVRDRWESEAISRDILGFFDAYPTLPPMLYVGDPTDSKGREVVRHELGHAFVNARFPEVPRWLNEGLARYLQTADYDPQTHEITWGEVDTTDLGNYSGGHHASMDELTGEEWPTSSAWSYSFQSGLLVHMLINRHESELECFFLKLIAREPFGRDDAAFNRCFSSFPQWGFELADYQFNLRFKKQVATATIATGRQTVSPVNDGQVLALLAVADYSVSAFILPEFRSARRDRAIRNAERAVNADQYDLLSVGVAVTVNPDPTRAARLTFNLAATRPNDWRAWRLRALTPGLNQEQVDRACTEAKRVAPTGVGDRQLHPCVVPPAASAEDED